MTMTVPASLARVAEHLHRLRQGVRRAARGPRRGCPHHRRTVLQLEPLEGLDLLSASVLVFSKTAGFRHDAIADGVAAIRALGEQNGFGVEVTEDAEAFTDDNLSRYRAVVFLLTSGDVLGDDQQAAFERFIRAGNGYVGVHSAADTEYDWAWYGGLVGAYFEGHPDPQVATVRVEDSSHPSTAGLPAEWARYDEWYNYRANPRASGVTVLATLDESTYSGGTMGGDHPIMWYHAYDGGRAWYTGGGHTSESYAEPLFAQSLLGGIRYAVGDPQPGVLQFSAAALSAGESAGQATVTVTRAGGSDGAVTVVVLASDGTAAAGSDYAAVEVTLTFAAGETSQTVVIPVLDDTLAEGDETILLTLSDLTSGATLGTPSTATLTLLDDEVPQVEGLLLNDGSAQRSRVTHLTVTFNGVVTLDPGAFELLRQGGGLVGLDVVTSVVDGRTVAVLTFTGEEVVAGSLADGNYTLTLRADLIRDAAGRPLDGDGDGTPGGDRLDAFFRYFGDSDGDRDVDLLDVVAFFGTFGRVADDPGFLGFFDFDGGGAVDTTDLLEFAGRYGTQLNP